MKRRSFLQQAGLLAAGATHVLAPREAAEAADARVAGARAPTDAAIKTVLVTSAHGELARIVAAELGRDYRVRLTAPTPVETAHELVPSDLSHDESTRRAVGGVEAVVHVAEPPLGGDEAAAIDYRTRCTYNLLGAAVEEGVRRVVYLSSLRTMHGCEPGFRVDEDWRPLPAPEGGGLSHDLGEFTCREFARRGDLDVIVLRLADVVPAGAGGNGVTDSAWIHPRDAARAVSAALARPSADQLARTGHWAIFHVWSHGPSPRFPILKAQKTLGYRPAFGGEES